MDFPRKLTPEILDALDQDDPKAIRSRRDLRIINTVLGGTRWILRNVDDLLSKDQTITKIVECGAGDGTMTLELASLLAEKHPKVSLTAVDLQPAPRNWQAHDKVTWHRGDLLKSPELFDEHTLVVANLMLHHFTAEQLGTLGKEFTTAKAAVLSEPHRWRKWMRFALYPLGLNSVTRHDMRISIESGFTDTELVDFLGFDSSQWDVISGSTFRGLHQVIARRKE